MARRTAPSPQSIISAFDCGQLFAVYPEAPAERAQHPKEAWEVGDDPPPVENGGWWVSAQIPQDLQRLPCRLSPSAEVTSLLPHTEPFSPYLTAFFSKSCPQEHLHVNCTQVHFSDLVLRVPN